jgi:small nuclear ribonucleoprotein (snRNP)-like protein
MNRELVERFGLPIAMLYTAKDTEVTIDLVGGEKWKGTVVGVDESGNVELCNATQLEPVPSRDVKSTMIRAGSIIFAAISDAEAMTAQWPMLKLVTRGGAGAPAAK